MGLDHLNKLDSLQTDVDSDDRMDYLMAKVGLHMVKCYAVQSLLGEVVGLDVVADILQTDDRLVLAAAVANHLHCHSVVAVLNLVVEVVINVEDKDDERNVFPVVDADKQLYGYPNLKSRMWIAVVAAAALFLILVVDFPHSGGDFHQDLFAAHSVHSVPAVVDINTVAVDEYNLLAVVGQHGQQVVEVPAGIHLILDVHDVHKDVDDTHNTENLAVVAVAALKYLLPVVMDYVSPY